MSKDSERLEGDLKGKKVCESRTSMTEFVLPNDANTHGNVLGGKVMHLMDLAAAVTAFRHCRNPVVTVSVDSVRFLHPVKVGAVMMLEAVITRAFGTSMEIQVEVRSEDLLTGEQLRTCSAYLTFVSIDKQGRPTPVPPLIPETQEENQRFEGALLRREHRLQLSSEEA
ncbi:MAG TPA: acyl-CoA thioesterase [Acidobacteriota bacterium]|nr:acyl-CoA thioesterase [Acidobacteriota bacterium]